MKALYKVMFFFACFQIVILTVNSLGVFPYTFYSDTEDEIAGIKARENQGLWDIVEYLFVPATNSFIASLSFTVLMGLFIGAGTAIAIATKSYASVSIIVIGYVFSTMITRSFGFFQKLFTNWDSPSLVYLGLTLGVGIVILVIITIVETPTHGRSGT